MADYVTTTTLTGTCSCCAGAPSGCSCALLIPPTALGGIPPYASYSDAATAIADLVADCMLYAASSEGSEAQLDTYTIAVTTGISIALASTSFNRGHGSISISLLSGETVTIAASVSTDGTNPARPAFVGASLYSCDGTLVDSGTTTGSETAASDTFIFTAPSDGEYILVVEGGGAGDATQFSLTDSITLSSTFWVNPVIALWDDSGTTRNLWACPKLLLPPLTESTGDWYASCADAAADIASNASNCVGYIETSPFTAFVATDGGTSLTLVMTGTGDSGSGAENDLTAWGGVNAVGGQTISIAFSAVGGFATTFYAEIYDDTGVSVQSFSGSGGSPFTSSALPYTGRYTIRVRFNTLLAPSPATIVATFIITSSGTMSVNTVQARWDDGLTCSANLDCGDACP